MKDKKKNEKVNLSKLNSVPTRVVYWVFQILIFATMVVSVVQLIIFDSQIRRNTQVTHIVLCIVGLLLYNLPTLVQRAFKVYVPSVIHIFVLLFIFAHFVLGEVVGVYTTSAVFDKVLHATSGFAIALLGFSVINLLNNSSSNSAFKLNPFFVAFFSFCFALAIALLWEIFEYASDSLIGTNMQRYKPPTDAIQAVTPKQGYGLIDTMVDVIVSTVSAFIVSVIGYIVLRRKKEFLNRFLMRKISDYDTAIAEAEEAGDERLAEALRKAKDAALAGIETDEILHTTSERPKDGQAGQESAEEIRETTRNEQEPACEEGENEK